MQLLLTAEEKQAFETLPTTLKDGWNISDETSTAYETPETLAIRYEMSSLKRHPQTKKILETVKQGKFEQAIMDGIPEDMLSDLFFTIGATGLSTIIKKLAAESQTDDDLAGLSSLTTIRHQLLLANASIHS